MEKFYLKNPVGAKNVDFINNSNSFRRFIPVIFIVGKLNQYHNMITDWTETEILKTTLYISKKPSTMVCTESTTVSFVKEGISGSAQEDVSDKRKLMIDTCKTFIWTNRLSMGKPTSRVE